MLTAYRKLGSNLYLENPGVLSSQLSPGMKFVHRPGVTISQSDNVQESLDSHNAAMLHYDEHYALHTKWRRPLVVSTLTVQKLLGMTSKTFARQRRIVKMHSIDMLKPLFAGDTLYAQTMVMRCDGPTNPDDSWVNVRLKTEGLNQKKQQLAMIDYDIEIWCHDAPQDFEDASPATDMRFASHIQRDDQAWVEQQGLFFEDMREGECFIHRPRRTLMAEEAALHAARSLEVGSQFFDWPYAQSSGLRCNAVPQAWLLSIVAALSTRLLGRVIANLGWFDVEFIKSVEVGDTIEARTRIMKLRSSASRPEQGIATVQTLAHNQRGELCLSFQRTLLVYKRSFDNPYASAGYA